jgi:hypothetical protein
MHGKIGRHVRSNIVGYVALFLALSGTAVADDGPLDGQDKVGSADIIDGEVWSKDVANDNTTHALTGTDIENGSLSGADVGGNSLRGSDIAESSLGQVPSAALGGVGRWSAPDGECDPESESFLTCAYVTLDLPARTRVLVVGLIRASTEVDSDLAIGDCLVATSVGAVGGSDVRVVANDSNIEFVPLTAVTPLVGPGPVDFGVECNQNEQFGAIRYSEMQVSAVALSSN